MNFIDSKFVREVSEITDNMYHQGWDERNGGNISYMIDEEFVREFYPVDKFIRDIEIGFVADEVLRGKYFLVTGTGKYFKNVIKDPETNLGLVKMVKSLTYYGVIKMVVNSHLNFLLI